MAEARQASGTVLAELRALVSGIHPPVLRRGLVDAIRARLWTRSSSGGDRRAGRTAAGPVESAAYFAVSELLANVTKHAEAHQCLDRHPL